MAKIAKCAIINDVCPQTNNPANPSKKGKYCPHWVDKIMETNTDQSGWPVDQIYTGCILARLPSYLVAIVASANHAAASYDKATTVLNQADITPHVKAVLTLGMASFVGEMAQIETNNQQQKEIIQCVDEKDF